MQRHINLDGSVKSPSAALRFAVKGLNVQKVRLALSLLARLAYESFYETVDYIF
ncbi:MAG: hypothetical protein JRC89_06205 [Deltaproteobacteria bacterium]|nr:hypothetical protein [Deltaproteobacteria bacterium]